MCGVFGFVSADGRGPDVAWLRRLALETESRGRHAFGLAWLEADGTLRTYKQPGAISGRLDVLSAVRKARVVIGHCRYATRGNPLDNANNHPHVAGDGVIVHNGTIFNAARLAGRYRMRRQTACDSEVLGQLIGLERGTLLERGAAAVSQLEGPAVCLGLWRRPMRLLIARRGKPLHFAVGEGGAVYCASLPEGLGTGATRIADNTVRVVSAINGELLQTLKGVPGCEVRPPERDPQLGRAVRQYVLPVGRRTPFGAVY